MEEILVSVCISVYNGGDTLRRCLNSVISQDIKRMEIIIVDDGSTDNSLQIMHEYKHNYPEKRILVLTQTHLGLAQGRLNGVKNAKGRYITFLDADDYLIDEAYNVVTEYMMRQEADIYEFQTMRKDYYSKSPYTGIMEAKQVLRDYFEGYPIPVNYWLRWFKRELFEEGFFPVGISLHEDVFAFPCIINRANTIAYIGKPLHVHTNDNISSIMNKYNTEENSELIFENQRILLQSVPHIVSNIGQDVIISEYKVPFNHYVTRLICSFLDINEVPYDQKLDAILEEIKLFSSREDLENFIKCNVQLNRKLHYLIRVFGVRKAYNLKRKWNHHIQSHH